MAALIAAVVALAVRLAQHRERFAPECHPPRQHYSRSIRALGPARQPTYPSASRTEGMGGREIENIAFGDGRRAAVGPILIVADGDVIQPAARIQTPCKDSGLIRDDVGSLRAIG